MRRTGVDRTAHATRDLTPFDESLTVGVLDWAGKFNAPVPGARSIVYGQMEAALILGSTTFLRNTYTRPTDPTVARDPERIRTFGAAATLGVVNVAGRGKDQWGALVGEIEAGYASGDGDPNDGTTRRFTFDQNHRVGLVLFNQVMAWKTARASTIAQDQEIVNRPAPGVQLLPSKGGVFGATTGLQDEFGEQRVAEVARMLGGERLSGTTLAHAKEMLGLP